MNRITSPRALLALALAASAIAAAPRDAHAIDRGQVMSRARAFAMHPWRMTDANRTASCSAGYESVHVDGDIVGLPYDWGGMMSLFTFDQAIEDGLGAGSYPDDGILDCTVGLDCSGFVSQAWQTGHYTTSSLHEISSVIDAGDLVAGDVFNEAGYHVAMFVDRLADGAPFMVEAIGYNVHYNATGGWAHVDGFVPRRFEEITGSSAVEPTGTPTRPIEVASFPYADSRNTATSPSDLLDGCGASPGTNESGREVVYEVVLDEPGRLTATIADDAGVDIDVHIYTSQNTSDCFARDDSAVTVDLDCGTYLVVADTYRSANGDQAGAYTLSMTFEPSGAACGAGPEGYAPSGGPGGACAYPGDGDLPFCNPNLGGEVCLYGDDASFCSMPCEGDGDCGAFDGGCCADIGDGERYCLLADFCAGEPPDPGSSAATGGDPGGDAASGAGGADGAGTTAASGGDVSSASGAGAADAGSGGAGSADDAGGDRDARDGGDDAASDGGGCALTGPSGSSRGGAGFVALLGVGALAARRRRAAVR
jgi:MYXO-CTERM domain-containing protein